MLTGMNAESWDLTGKRESSVRCRTYGRPYPHDNAHATGCGGHTGIEGVVVTVFAVGFTIAAGLVVLNLKGGEKQVEQTIARLYDVKDDQFGRAMGVLLGPPNIAGNRFDVLLNGDEIFPSMLSAIRSAERDDQLRELYLLVGLDRPGVRGGAFGARAGRRQGASCCWIGSAAASSIPRSWRRWKTQG